MIQCNQSGPDSVLAVIYRMILLDLTITMAAGGARRLYEEEDLVDEYLLNQLSKWILYHRLRPFARDLGITDAEVSRIVIPSKTPEEQIFQVRDLQTHLRSRSFR